MMSREEVLEQEKRYNLLLESVDMVKLGNKFISIMVASEDMSVPNNYVRRYLRFNGVEYAMCIPSRKPVRKFYGEYLIEQAVSACLESYSETTVNV